MEDLHAVYSHTFESYKERSSNQSRPSEEEMIRSVLDLLVRTGEKKMRA